MLQEYTLAALQYIENSGHWGFFIYHLILFIQIIVVCPITPLELAGGFLFKNTYGIALTSFTVCMTKFAANLGSVFAARHFFRDWVNEKIVAKHELLRLVRNGIKDEPYKLSFLIRGAMIPLGVKNYGLGVMEVGYLPIICGSLVFTPVYGFRNIYLGSGLSDIAEIFAPPKAGDGPVTLQDRIKKMMPIICNVLLVVVTIKIFMNQINKQRKREEEKLKSKQAQGKSNAKPGETMPTKTPESGARKRASSPGATKQ